MTDQTFDHDDNLFDDGADRVDTFRQRCPACDGYGWLTRYDPFNRPCTRCGGVGWVERESEADDPRAGRDDETTR